MTTVTPVTAVTSTVLNGIGIPQALRWHEDALWFSDIAAGTVHRWDGSGAVAKVADVPGAGGLGWLPDGRLLVVSARDQCVYRQEPDGSLSVHTDLSAVAGGALNDMITDEQGRAYVGNYGFDYEERTRDHPHAQLFRPPGPAPTPIACLAADGSLAGLSDPVVFPNGCTFLDGGRTLLVAETLAFRLTAFTVSPEGLLVDRRTWASLIPPWLWRALTAPGLKGTVVRRIAALLEHPRVTALSRKPALIAPDDLAASPDGTVWVANSLGGECLRMGPGAEVLERVVTSQHTLGCVLGGADGHTLFVATVSTLDPELSATVRGGRIETFRLPEIPTTERGTAMRTSSERSS
jgi:sugar lactone lactonase YvrE